MSEYLSIGKVAKLKNVSIKSLRYYDEIGIFQPAYINPQTNYRYYTRSQLPLLDAISLCIEVGIPLRDLASYRDQHGNVDLHSLLCDGKVLAEKKIKSMGKRLETLSRTIQELQQPGHALSMPVKFLQQRRILALPFDETTTSSHYTHLILHLFVQAQRLGLKATYPSGFLYQHTEGELLRYVFVLLGDTASPPDAVPPPFVVFTLKAGNYYYVKGQTHQIDRATQVFARIPEASGRCLFIETDLLKDNEVDKFELQLLKIE